MKKISSLFAVLFLLGINCFGQSGGTWLWGTECSSHSRYGSEGTAVVIDEDNNAYLTGAFSDTMTAGTFKLTTPTKSENAFIIKYDASGIVLWAKQSQQNSVHSGAVGGSMVTDGLANVYITGYFGDTVSFGTFQLQSKQVSMFLVKYDLNGNVIWAKQSDVSSKNAYSEGNSVTIDKTGNIYVTGNSKDTISFDSITLNAPGLNFFTVKYDPNGNVIWAKQPTMVSPYLISRPYAIPNSIAVDKFNNIYITGKFSDSLVIGSTTLYGSKNVPFAFIVKYDSNGNVLWARQSDCLQSENGVSIKPNSITASNDGYVYITGEFSDTVSFGKVKLISSVYPDFQINIFLLKLDSAGNAIWAKSSTSTPNHEWTGYIVALDTQNHIYISGGGPGIKNSFIQFGSDILTVANTSGDGSSILVEFDTSGNVLCGTILAGGGDDNNGLAVSLSSKYVYLGGDMYTAIVIGPDSLPYNGAEVPFMARWQPCCEGTLSPGFLTSSRDTLCPGQTSNLILTKNSSDSIQWQSSIPGGNFADIPEATDTTKYQTQPLNQSTFYQAIISNGNCLAASNTIELIVPPPLIAAFTASGSNTMAAFNSGNSLGQIRNYYWDFGDGATSAAANPTHTFAKDTIHDVCLTIYDGSDCSYTTCNKVDLRALGIASVKMDNKLEVYPNPAGNFINLSTEGLTGNYQLSIYNVMGQQVWQQTIKLSEQNLTSVDLSAVPADAYDLVLMNTKDYYSKRFVRTK